MIRVYLVLLVQISLLCGEAGHRIRFEYGCLNICSPDYFEFFLLSQLCRPRLIDPHVVDHLTHLPLMLEEAQKIVPIDVCL